MLIALFFVGLGVVSLIAHKGTGNNRGLGLILITIGVIMLALLIEYPHR